MCLWPPTSNVDRILHTLLPVRWTLNDLRRKDIKVIKEDSFKSQLNTKFCISDKIKSDFEDIGLISIPKIDYTQITLKKNF